MSSSNSIIFLCFYVFICALIPSSINASKSSSQQQQQESDRILKLPGQPKTINQYSGYINVNQDHGRALFYWFFQAQSQPSNKPLLLWLNGGPGCSSIGYGALAELGPLRIAKNGDGLTFNKYSWNQEANLLFLESPVGVGFSYTNQSSDITKLNDKFVAEDAYNFLVNWLERFPQYKTHDFYISGESYAGHYVPQLAEVIYDHNKYTTKYPIINLKGFIVGNPETNDYYDYKGLLEYAWSHAVISDQEYETAKKVCDFKVSEWSHDCNVAMTIVFNKYKEIDIYNIYAPSCLLNTTTTTSLANENEFSHSKVVQRNGIRRMRFIPGGGGYDPCYSNYARDYLNRIDVQTALHANTRGVNASTIKWDVCNDFILRVYNYSEFSILPIYKKLIKGGLKIWIYSGDTDGRVPVIGSRYCIEALGLPLKSPWRSWYHNHQVGGRIVEYEGLSFVTIRGAGHLVPLNKPSEALALIHSFLVGQNLPTNR